MFDGRARDRRHAVGAALFVGAMLTAAIIRPWLPITLQRWWLLLVLFGASVYAGIYGWVKLKQEPLVTAAFGYSIAGLFGSMIPIVFTFLLPRQFALLLSLVALVAFTGVFAGGRWVVRKHPSILSDGLWSASVLLFFSVVWLLLGSLAAYVYASRGWLAF